MPRPRTMTPEAATPIEARKLADLEREIDEHAAALGKLRHARTRIRNRIFARLSAGKAARASTPRSP